MSVVCSSPAMQRLNKVVERVAPTDLTVLITGESGVGKEIIARRIFELSRRHGQPFVKINSAAIPDTLVESEMFGYDKGAFTGAVMRKAGRVAMANEGTIFFDEIAEMNTDSQSKLLQIIQDSEFTPLGTNQTVKIDVRIIAATNKDLQSAVDSGTFREDLFYRLNVVHIQVPPLRERRLDVPLLVEYFVSKYSRQFQRPKLISFQRREMDAMCTYDWPGNIRELENFVKNLVLL
ncbi:MAG: sigma 54-interacting transcriptional regulator, partial [Acidobacteriota bacterium]